MSTTNVRPLRSGIMPLHPNDSRFGRFVENYLFEVGTIVLALVAAYSVYQGARFFFEGALHHLMMAAVSLIVELSVYLYLHRTYPYASSTGRRHLAWGLLVAIPFIVCLSTIMGMGFFGGDTALRNRMNKIVEASETEFNRVYGDVKSETQIAAQLDVLSKQFAALAAQERQGGLTGTTGTGSVSTTIQSVSTMLGQMRNAMSDGQQKADSLRRELEDKLGELRTIVYGVSGQGSRTVTFGTKLSEFNALLAQLQATSVKPTITTLAEQLTRVSAVATVAGAGNTAVASRQAAALENVRGSTLAAQETIIKLTGVKNKPIAVQSFSSADIFQSLFSEMTIGSWISLMIAIAVDFAPLLFLKLKTNVIDDRRRRMQEDQEAQAAALAATGSQTA